MRKIDVYFDLFIYNTNLAFQKKNLKIFQFEYMIINTLPKHRIENKILEGVLDVEVTNPQLYELNTYE